MKFDGNRIDQFLTHRYPLAVLGLALTVALLLILRCFNAVFYPVLHCEDGTEMIAYYFNDPDPAGLLRFYAGYIQLIPNLIGYFAVTLFPLSRSPYVLIACCMALSVATLSMFSLRRFRFVLRDDKKRMLICLSVALVPLGNHALITATEYSLWHVFLISLLLVIAPLPASRAVRIGQYVFVVCAIFSNPLAILFIPICLILLWARPALEDRIVNVGIIVLTVIYYLLCIDYSQSRNPAGLDSFVSTLELFIHRIVFESVFGNSLRVVLHNAGQTLVISVLAFAVLGLLGLLIVYVNRKNPARTRTNLWLLGVTSFVMFAITFIAVVGRSLSVGADSATNPWAQRYYYQQQLLFVFVIAFFVVQVVDWKAMSRLPRIALAVCLLGYVSFLNVHNLQHFRTSKEIGIRTMQFLRTTQEEYAKVRRGELGPRQMILERGGRWDIIIDLNSPRD